MTVDQIIGITLGCCGVYLIIISPFERDRVESKLTRLEGLAFITVSILTTVMP
jgi:hypothetical protein